MMSRGMLGIALCMGRGGVRRRVIRIVKLGLSVRSRLVHLRLTVAWVSVRAMFATLFVPVAPKENEDSACNQGKSDYATNNTARDCTRVAMRRA